MTMKEIRNKIDEGKVEQVSIEDLTLYFENMKARKNYNNQDAIALLYAITEMQYAELYG